MLSLSLMVTLLASYACSQTQDLKSLSMDEINPAEAKRSGAQLMRLKDGLHRLNADSKTVQDARPRLVLVHGYGSRGYEWVYAAHRLAHHGAVYFYRWNWDQCPQEAGAALLESIHKLAELNPKRPIEVWGHSYGGVITAVAAARYRGSAPLTAQVIASPVAGHPLLEERCAVSIKELTRDLERTSAPPPAVSPSASAAQPLPIRSHALKITAKINQWRTQHHLDGAFKRLKVDPQIVAWRGEVIRLPDAYRERRLGHNWSISWVVDHLYPASSP